MVRRAQPRAVPRGGQRVVPLKDDLDLVLVDADYADGSAERYQVIVGWTPRRCPSTAQWQRSGRRKTAWGFDALYDTDAPPFLLSLIDSSAVRVACGVEVTFAKEPDVECR
ncbi:pep2 domain protein [Mycobacterium kansasii]|uniref:Pep2 domain protein n=1 Tax=Mycobacterium kansasii TaxID=1768 RepID=A0A1V3W9L0_MYCKA|nr:pep2 domain protein [Mycobacterium kansasii]